MFQIVRSKIVDYAKTHKAQMRLFCFVLAFVVVWSQASNIQDLTRGFFDGVSAAQGQP